MGLLDDAIREHLELKRLRGADPGEVVREEREALGSGLHGERDVQEEYDGDRADASEVIDERHLTGTEPDRDADVATGAGETEELDMEDVMDSRVAISDTSASTGYEHRTEQSIGTSEESLEWEVPGERPQELQEHAAGPEAHG